MGVLREWLHRVFGTVTLGGRRRDQELEQELRSHLELAAEDAQRRGETPAQATIRYRPQEPRDSGHAPHELDQHLDLAAWIWSERCLTFLRLPPPPSAPTSSSETGRRPRWRSWSRADIASEAVISPLDSTPRELIALYAKEAIYGFAAPAGASLAGA